jgi:GxxExxY protein
MLLGLNNLKYGDVTGKAIKCGFQVYNFFGRGYPEIVYKKALRIDFLELAMDFKYEEEKDIFYKNNHIHTRRLDFLLEEKVLLEVKAIKEIDSGDINQVLNYLNIFKLDVALLFNFGQNEFYFKRLIKKDI